VQDPEALVLRRRWELHPVDEQERLEPLFVTDILEVISVVYTANGCGRSGHTGEVQALAVCVLATVPWGSRWALAAVAV
jgi:hypothetical protein